MEIYFDNHTATKPCKPVEELLKQADFFYGMVASPHKVGQRALLAIESEYFKIYDLVGADLKEGFIVTPSLEQAIEKLFYAIFFNVIQKTGKNHILFPETEDAFVFYITKKLQEFGCVVKKIKMDEQGKVDLNHFKSLLGPKVGFVSISYANGLTGVINPIEEIGALCKENETLLHVEGSYSIGKAYINFSTLPIDFLTFSGHLIHGLKLSGALFFKNPHFFDQSDLSKEHSFSIDPLGLITLAAASKQMQLFADKMGTEVVRLRNLFEDLIEEKINGAQVVFKEAFRLPNVSAIFFQGVHQEALLYRLNQKNLFATFGGSYNQPLHQVLKASQVDTKKTHTALSFSFSRYTTQKDIEEGVKIIEEEVNFLQSMSKYL